MPAPAEGKRSANPAVAADPTATTSDPSAQTPGLSALPTAATRYTLGNEIARGGMGIIYRATDTTLHREVAVKVLQERFAVGSRTARRFADEARITGQLQHPNIPAVHDLGTLADGRPFLAMKLIKGQTLEDWFRQRTNVADDRGRILAVFEQVCQALAYAHAHQVLHRDLKPANVMVGAFGEVQVMDWGLAKVLGARQTAADDPQETTGTEVRCQRESNELFTQAGSVLGTPAYMPPEQAIGAVEQIDARSDVFGLGGILCAALTGSPPFAADTAERTRQVAARGKVDHAFAQLDACGAEPDLVALCKRCLAPEKADRPADAGEVARAVADLRAAADERARQAELDRVKAEADQATAQARSVERRQRRRLWTLSAAALTLAVVGGLAAVLIVQEQANTQLEARNRELADEKAKLAARNADLAEARVKVENRFDLAMKIVGTFTKRVSEDGLLKNEQFKDLRTRLLTQAAGYYTELGMLLADQTDARARKALGTGYFQLGELTEMISSQSEALAVHRKALAVRRELAAAPAADVETRLDVARSLSAVGHLLSATGDKAGALAARQEQRHLAEQLETEEASNAVRSVLANSHHNIGRLLQETGKATEAMAAYEKARDIQQKLADANPAATQFQGDLAMSYKEIGILLSDTGKPTEAMAAYEKARDIQEKLADANVASTQFQSDLATSQDEIGYLLSQTGNQVEALAAMEKARAIRQKLADANPAVTQFQRSLAASHNNVGWELHLMNKPAEAMTAMEKARDIHQKLVDANPAVIQYQASLTMTIINLGLLQAQQGDYRQAFAALDQGIAQAQKLLADHPTITFHTILLGESYLYRGWARVRAKQPSEAAADLRQAIELFARIPTLNAGFRFERSWGLVLLAGLGADAKSGVTAAEAAAFADQAMAALRDAVKAGWGSTAELKEPDFDPLHARADFRALLQKLESKTPPKKAPIPEEAKK